jgi:protein-disulfide isomerase
MGNPVRTNGTAAAEPGVKHPSPTTRRQRREAARGPATGKDLAAARTRAATNPWWRSPLVLLTLGAVLAGLVVIVGASGILTAKQTASGLTQPLQPAPISLVDPADPRALGRADAPVVVEVWSDFQCPYCRQFALTTEPGFIEQYVKTGKARLVYRDLIVNDPVSKDPAVANAGESHQSAAAARCATDQGKFWPFHDYLLENQKGENKGTFSAVTLAKIADAVGLDRAKYDACMAGGAAAKVADANAESAAGIQAGIGATPTIVVNGVAQVMPGQTKPGGAIDLAQLGKAVDTALAAASSSLAPPGASGAQPSP